MTVRTAIWSGLKGIDLTIDDASLSPKPIYPKERLEFVR
jgi:hypothetical protein